jgi:hypothetical protein
MGSPTRQAYRTVNGCKRQLECEQVFWAAGAAILLAAYSVFLALPLLQDGRPALLAAASLTYLLMLPVGYDYLVLTCADPVDPNILA